MCKLTAMSEILSLKPTAAKRFALFFFVDMLLFTASIYMSFLLRFDFAISPPFTKMMTSAMLIFIVIKPATLIVFGIYRITWRYVGIMDLYNIAKALIAAQLILVTLLLLDTAYGQQPIAVDSLRVIESLRGFPRSILGIDLIMSFIMISGLRLSKRLYNEIITKGNATVKGHRTIIVGAGNTGEMILRDMLKFHDSGFTPMAFVDDDINMIGVQIHGIRVFGEISRLKEAVQKFAATSVLIAIPSLNYIELRRIYDLAKSTNATDIKIVPRIYDFQKPNITLKSIEEISIEDLIGRQAIEVDFSEIRGFIEDKIILVTGAGGSIGSELSKQICAFDPKVLVLFDIDETELHNMHLRLAYLFPNMEGRVHFVVGDIRDEDRLDAVFKAYQCHTVFHAAAYKHVPMMESNEIEAVKVNIFGTYLLSRLAVRHSVEKFVLISTDKAVRPTSVMGATKRMAEYICSAFNDVAATKFVSVRFGNVLGSRGSVLPVFLEQMRRGGPLTVTHREVNRFFMTVQEAVSLVLQAAAIGSADDILVLDMGKPVKIIELAEELIKIHGYKPYVDIDIIITGLRPGEKIFEEILTSKEESQASRHKSIYIAKGYDKYTLEDIEKMLEEFASVDMSVLENDAVKRLLRKYIVHYSALPQ
ncbi:MAG: polysaccharide biosynthesis protein [Candidatus Magnetominusculus sp. LBB02]|nr:polysaccharide biosynthesis protein [Candidatus Magnetominusculus sp. LBB02]